jgi:hypothetical protein
MSGGTCSNPALAIWKDVTNSSGIDFQTGAA